MASLLASPGISELMPRSAECPQPTRSMSTHAQNTNVPCNYFVHFDGAAKHIVWAPARQAKDLGRLACVCAELREAASANDLWRPLFEAEFGEASLAEATAGARGWKALL